MDKIPVAYTTTCSDRTSGSVVSERVFEAITREEAETRALLNCVREGNRLDDIVVNAKRVSGPTLH